ncbi:MAG: N-acetylneuraminate synthase family protein [Anaerolineaceae bacterium]
MSHPVEIENRKIGPGNPCLIVCEVAQAHDGSLGTAHAFVDAAAKTGADAIKFQTHIASAESTPQEPFRVKFSHQDATRYDYWKRMEFTAEQWAGLAAHAHEMGLIFLSSPFSEAAVEMLDKIGMPAWKIASGEVNNALLMDRIYLTGKPILLSSGMSSLEETDRAVQDIRLHGNDFVVLQCTSKYPSPPENVGLNMLEVYRQRYQVPVGLSDHSGKIYPGLAAVTMGANLLEVHITLSREMFGPDVPASLDTREMKELVEGVRFIEQTLAHPLDKQLLAKEMEGMRQIFGKGLVIKHDLKAGHRLTKSDLTAKKPAAGIPVEDIETVLGKPLRVDKRAGEFLQSDEVQREAKDE